MKKFGITILNGMKWIADNDKIETAVKKAETINELVEDLTPILLSQGAKLAFSYLSKK